MNKIEYIGIKEDGKAFRVVNSKLLTEELNRLPKGRYRLIVDRKRKDKSNPQLAWLYGQIYPIVLRALNDAGWEFTSLDEVDAFCKSRFTEKEMLNKHTGEIMVIPGLKRYMSTVDMMTYVEGIRSWCSEFLNTEIPDPGENFEMNFD